MELSTAWLEWLVLGASHELMLFASVGILLIGLDDLLFDALWLATRRRGPPSAPGKPPLEGRIAIFVPAWDEAKALPAMLHRTLAAWGDEDFRLYVGCYPNDAATLFAVSPLIARDRRLRLVIGGREGPTTKGDNLNGYGRRWARMSAPKPCGLPRSSSMTPRTMSIRANSRSIAVISAKMRWCRSRSCR